MSADRPAEKYQTPNKPAAANDRYGRIELVTALLITLWIVFLHVLYLFRAGPLWRDEAGTVDFAAMPTLGDIWRNLRYDNFPPLFVAVARVWTLAGLDSDFSFRLLGFLVGMGTLGILWLCARRLGGNAPLLVLALYAANPVAIRVGDALRPYGLGIVLVLLTSALVWNFVQKPGRKTLVWAALAAALSVQCLYQSALFIIACSCGAWAVALGRREWKTAWQAGIIGLAAALSLLPYCVVFRESLEWSDIARREIDFDWLLDALRGALQAPGQWMSLVWAVLCVAALAGEVFFGRRHRNWLMVYCATVLAVSLAVYPLFLRAVELPPRSWYFLILMAPAALMVDSILGGLNSRCLQLGRTGFSLILILACARACYLSVQFRQSNIDLVAAKLKEAAQPGDLILVFPWHYGVSLQRYLDASRWSTVPPIDDIRIHRYDLVKKAMMTGNAIGPLLDKARAALRSGHRLWLVGEFQSPPADANELPAYPPYRDGMKVTEDMYFSSWMFQIADLAQKHAREGGPVKIAVPGGRLVNPLEDVSMVAVRGWRE
ncbi:MAG: glycosyltransferase family 39 protein [Limisphaerales bacterium]